MTDPLTEIRSRLGAATPSPWVVEGYDVMRIDGIEGPHDEEVWLGVAIGFAKPDAEFIAHAPADIAWLLDEVERYRADEAERGRISGELRRLLNEREDD